MTHVYIAYKKNLGAYWNIARTDMCAFDSERDALLHVAGGLPGVEIFELREEAEGRVKLHGFREDGLLEVVSPGELNCYHDRIFDGPQVPPGPLFHLIRSSIAGRLTHDQFSTFAREHSYSRTGDIMGSHDARERYSKACSWAIYTSEWADDVAKLLRGKRVVEICAGRGILGPIMQERGLDWTCTDLCPPRGVTHVEKLDAMDAIRELQPDVVFASWIPYESTDIDYQIATMGMPMLVVGEGWGGCTGSKKFWGSYSWDDDDEEKEDAIPRPYKIVSVDDVWRSSKEFSDVPQWDGIHDYTLLVIPEGHEAGEFFAS